MKFICSKYIIVVCILATLQTSNAIHHPHLIHDVVHLVQHLLENVADLVSSLVHTLGEAVHDLLIDISHLLDAFDDNVKPDVVLVTRDGLSVADNLQKLTIKLNTTINNNANQYHNLPPVNNLVSVNVEEYLRALKTIIESIPKKPTDANAKSCKSQFTVIANVIKGSELTTKTNEAMHYADTLESMLNGHKSNDDIANYLKTFPHIDSTSSKKLVGSLKVAVDKTNDCLRNGI